MADDIRPNPYPGAPKYFKRVYDRRGKHYSRVEKRVMFIDPIAGERIVIYGYGCRSPYAEDQIAEDAAWNRSRTFLSNCFSKLAPDGELGFTPADEVEEITQEEFEKARAEGWPE